MNAKQRRKARRNEGRKLPFFRSNVTELWFQDNYDLTLEEIQKAAAIAQQRGAAFDPDTIKFLQEQAAEVLKFVTRD